MEKRYIIEKFTRCPGCRSFSLKSDEIPGVSPGNAFVCNNCGAQFAFRGNTLVEMGSLLHQNKQEPLQREPGPLRIEKRRFSRTAIFLFFFLCLLCGGILLLLHPWNQDQEQIEAPQKKIDKDKNSASFMPEKEVMQKEVNKTNLEKPVIKETGKAKGETRAIETVKVSQFQDEPKTESPGIVPISYKIFDDSGLSVRSSFPNLSDRSQRWNFKRKTITIKRSKTQRVYIAGDPTGKTGWAVDDEIVINGERIKGVSEEMTESGYIPASNRLPPCDITHLVSADRKTVLDIRLVDYGIFWGNTSLYIVVM
jgi:hypothetical protein